MTNTYNQVICSGAATIVIHRDEVLLEKYQGQQSNTHNARLVQCDTQFLERVREGSIYYVFPGGGIEERETPDQTAKRGALEELGVQVILKNV
ncbi:NUDIX domain-containing protein [Salipaludibacillus sp. CF4.18]|uniref:NUDIX domain-containing protein n=1 Tax=Salipaludibacillus sp. CF4.18 TaxID=3373081 RepID=UPI003EE4D92D